MACRSIHHYFQWRANLSLLSAFVFTNCELHFTEMVGTTKVYLPPWLEFVLCLGAAHSAPRGCIAIDSLARRTLLGAILKSFRRRLLCVHVGQGDQFSVDHASKFSGKLWPSIALPA